MSSSELSSSKESRKRRRKFYVVTEGREPGVYDSWEEASEQVLSYSGAVYKAFSSLDAACEYATKTQPLKRSHSAAKQQQEERHVYTDGACSQNGRRHAKAGVGVWWGPSDPRNVSCRCSSTQTNQRAELEAIVYALREMYFRRHPLSRQEFNDSTRFVILTDSKFAIDCIERYIPAWERSFGAAGEWKKKNGEPVKHQDLLKEISVLLKSMPLVQFEHVRSHIGIAGNEEADKLAVAGSKLEDSF